MRIIEKIILAESNDFASSHAWQQAKSEIDTAIGRVVWPEGAPDFAVRPERTANGVIAIKTECMTSLQADGWQVEQNFKIPGEVQPGPIDAQKNFTGDLVLLEWETGNISSSHRALNKMCIALRRRLAAAGVLIVPDRTLARYLTDRIGNVRELRPYFKLWEEMLDGFGPVMIYVVAHDREDASAPKMPKMKDGNAKQYLDRLKMLKEASGEAD
jgi:hypothetical protein